MSDELLTGTFVEAVCRNMEKNLGQLRRCAGLLGDDWIWSRENEHCNSVGNLLLHLTGNVRQWIVGGVGGRKIERDRPAEFAARGGHSAEEMIAGLEAVVREAIAILSSLGPEDMTQLREIQTYEVPVVEAVYHVGEHFSLHTGQVVHITKARLDVDLSLYNQYGQRRDAEAGHP